MLVRLVSPRWLYQGKTRFIKSLMKVGFTVNDTRHFPSEEDWGKMKSKALEGRNEKGRLCVSRRSYVMISSRLKRESLPVALGSQQRER